MFQSANFRKLPANHAMVQFLIKGNQVVWNIVGKNLLLNHIRMIYMRPVYKTIKQHFGSAGVQKLTASINGNVMKLRDPWTVGS